MANVATLPKLHHPDDEDEVTAPAAPAAIRRATVVPREGWTAELSGRGGPIVSVSIACLGCLRVVVLKPPRYSVDEEGEVTANDEGAAFRCRACDVPIGPLRLAAWRLGRMGSP